MKLTLTIFLLLTLIIPKHTGIALSVGQNAWQYEMPGPAFTEIGASVYNIRVLETVPALAQPSVALTGLCDVKVGENGPVVQFGGVINLNQSASCFKWVEAAVPVSVKLSVVLPEKVNLPVKVLARHVFVQPFLLPGFPETLPAIPAQASVISLAALLYFGFFFRKIQTRLVRGNNYFRIAFRGEVLVLRC